MRAEGATAGAARAEKEEERAEKEEERGAGREGAAMPAGERAVGMACLHSCSGGGGGRTAWSGLIAPGLWGQEGLTVRQRLAI